MYFEISVLAMAGVAVVIGMYFSYFMLYCCAAIGGTKAPRWELWLLVFFMTYHFLVSQYLVFEIVKVFHPFETYPSLHVLVNAAIILGACSKRMMFGPDRLDFLFALAGILFHQSNGKIGCWEALSVANTKITDDCPWVNAEAVLSTCSRNAFPEDKVRTQLKELELFYVRD